MPPKRSRFVTVLGWLAAGIGVISVPWQVLGLISIAINPDPANAVFEGATHPIEVFISRNLVLVAVMHVVAAVLLLLVGIGLIRRRYWTLYVGAAFLAFGAFDQVTSLALWWSGTSLALAKVTPESAQTVSTMCVCSHLASFLWLGFLFWFFRRPSIKSEFSPGRVAA